MATLPTQFGKALSAVEPDDDATHAQDAHAQVSEVLEGDERLRGLGVDPVLIGSYKRHVSIKRVNTPAVDRDLHVWAACR